MSGIVTPDRVCATCQYWEQHDCEEVTLAEGDEGVNSNEECSL